jgi:hypothetical protein
MTSSTALDTTVEPLTQSKFEQMACEYSYGAQAIEGRHTAGSEASWRGQEVHAVMAKYVEWCGENKVAGDWGVFDAIAATISLEAGRICDGLRDRFLVDYDHIIACEDTILLDENFRPVASILNAAYKGTLDALYMLSETEALIEDYKSHPMPFEPDTFQSIQYPVLVFQKLPEVQKVTFRLRFVRWNVTREVTWSRADLPKMMAEMARARARQKKTWESYQFNGGLGGLHVSPHAGCHYCPLLQMGDCPVADVNPHSQDVVELVRELQFLRKRSQFVTQILKDAHQAMGWPIVATDDNGTEMSFGTAAHESLRYPATRVLPLVQQWAVATNDGAFLQSLSIRSTDIKSKLATKKRASLEHEVEQVLEKSTKTRTELTTRNIGEAEPEEEW